MRVPSVYRRGPMKRLLVLLPGDIPGNVYGLHRMRCDAIGRAVRDQGLAVEFLAGDGSPAFLRALMDHLRGGDSAVFAGYFFYDLALRMHGRAGWQNLFEVFDCPVIGQLGDHLFAPFVRDRLGRIGATHEFMACDTDLIGELEFLLPGAKSWCNPSPPFYASSRADCERAIDLLVPLNLHKLQIEPQTYRTRVARIAPDLLALHDVLLEALSGAPGESTLAVFRRCHADVLGHDFELGSGHASQRTIQDLLHAVDFRVRSERRLRALEAVAAIPGIRVVVTERETALAAPPRASLEFVGRQSADTVGQLMRQARFCLNVAPSYRHDVGSRVLNALQAGCAVVTDSSPGLRQRFRAGQEMLFFDVEEGLDAGLVAMDDSNRVAINAAAREVVKDLSLKACAARLAARVRELPDR